MKKISLLLILFVLMSFLARGQRAPEKVLELISFEQQQDTTPPSLLYQYYFGSLDSLNRNQYPLRYIAPNPLYYRLFTPLTLYYAPARQINEFTWHYQPMRRFEDTRTETLLPFNRNRFTSIDRANRQVNRILLDTYLRNLNWVVTTESQIMSRQPFREDIGVDPSPKTSVISLFKPEPILVSVGEAEVIVRRPNFWTKGGNGSLQLTQNYISDNWHKGGDSNKSMLANLRMFANYNDKSRVQFENSFEAKVGFITNKADTLHSYNMNADLLRLYSKLGVQAASKWFYTISGEFNTQFFRNYKTNTNTVQSAFLAPANLILSAGMDYKHKTKKMNLSVFISPLAYNLRYVGTDKVDETRFGLEEGEKTMHDFGSKLQTTLEWRIIPSVVWSSRLYYFTNYKKAEAEWENTFNFVLNRYLSTRVFVHARFDDGARKIRDNSYFQLLELLSFGLNYTW